MSHSAVPGEEAANTQLLRWFRGTGGFVNKRKKVSLGTKQIHGRITAYARSTDSVVERGTDGKVGFFINRA